MSDITRANARRAVSILAVSALVLVALGALVGVLVGSPLVGVVAGVVAGVGLALWVRTRATDMVVRATGAVPATADDHPRLHNLVDGLCLTSGVPAPELFVVDDPAPDVLVAGRDPRRAAIIFTSGMLDTLDLLELEGVVAHQLARIRHDDVGPATLLAVLGRLAGPFVRSALAPDRLVTADLEACQLTRYPPGLIGALQKLDDAADDVGSVPSARSSAAAHLWFVPHGDTPHHPPLEERIALLREL